MLWFTLTGLAMLAAASCPAVTQEARREIGVLTCELAQSQEAQAASEAASQRPTQSMLCAFRPGNRGPEETYTGTLQYLVADRQLPNTRVMIWIVKASSATMETAGLLQQTYAADPAAPVVHAPALIGESNGSIILQPMADSPVPTATGQSAAAALIVLVALRLKSTSG
jgi:hypothetical protein